MMVWVTRDEPADGPLASALKARGLEPIVEPAVQRVLKANPDELLRGLGESDWLVLTSPFAIEVVAQAPLAKTPNVAVVGESSARLARQYGLRVSMAGADGHGETLFTQLRETVPTGVVCYPRSALAKAPAPWAGIELRSPVLYDTTARPFDRERVKDAVIAAVAAPSQVRALAEVDIALGSIGRATSKTIRSQGREPVVEADYPTFENLAEAIARYLRV